MLAEVGCLVINKLPGRRREQNLPTVAAGGDPRAEVNVDSDVPLLCDERFACVNAHSYTHRAVTEASLRVACGANRVRGARERNEECISLRVDLDPAVPREGIAQDTTMFGQNFGIAFPELLKQARRPLDVREKQRDGPARQLAHTHMIPQRKSSVPCQVMGHRRLASRVSRDLICSHQ